MKIYFLFILLLATIPAKAQNIVRLTEGQIVEKQLNSKQTDKYSIQLSKGSFFSCVLEQDGIDVEIEVWDPKQKKIHTFDAPTGDKGLEKIAFAAIKDGMYQLSVAAIEDEEEATGNSTLPSAGNYRINNIKILSPQAYKQQQEKEEQDRKNTIAWLTAQAHPLAQIAAGNDFADLEWLKPELNNVTCIGLGEETHGTKEFFQLKHRLVAYLVKELGFKVFAIEASYAGCRNINDYVLQGKGNARTALASQGFWTWDTEEMISLIEWMREYNSSQPENKKVSFHGFDIQNNTQGGGIERIKGFLQQADPSLAQQADSVLKLFTMAEKARMNVEYANFVKEGFFNLMCSMMLNRGHYVLATSEDSFRSAMEYLTVANQYLDYATMADNDPRLGLKEWRDYYMAANIKCLVQAHPGEKAIVWAHNNHISKNTEASVNGGANPLGSYLGDAYGDKYYAVGFFFNKGGFQAIEMDNNTGKANGLREFVTKDAKSNSLEWYLSQTRKNRFIVSLRQKDIPAYANAFMEQEFMTRAYGAFADRATYNEDYFAPVVLKTDFNAVIFIDHTSRSTPTATGKR